jgi:hypothetical protein
VKRIALLTLILMVAFAPTVGSAQDGNEAAVALLPAPETFGAGWTLLVNDPTEDLLPVFRAATVGSYGGPAGARVVLNVLLVGEGMTAVRGSWEQVTDYLQEFDTRMVLEVDDERNQAIEAMAPPDGCSDVRRVEGHERIGGTAFPVGVTLCAADPDVLLVAVVSGEMNGRTGLDASDAVIEMTLAAQSATPTP